MLILNETSQKLILKEMSRKGRFHHTYAHVCDILEVLHANKEKFSNFRAAELAAIFHDIVYEVDERYKSNELESCRKFLEVIYNDNPNLSYDEEDPDYQTVKLTLAMIGCTQHHSLDGIKDPKSFTAAEINDIKMFLDADINVLARSRERVMQFEKDIRAEFSCYDDEAYRKGRADVLRSFLQRKNIFLSSIDESWEGIARNNLLFILDSLK